MNATNSGGSLRFLESSLWAMRPADVQALRKILKEAELLAERARNALGRAATRADAARALLEEAQSSLPFGAKAKPPKLRRVRYSSPEQLLYAASAGLWRQSGAWIGRQKLARVPGSFGGCRSWSRLRFRSSKRRGWRTLIPMGCPGDIGQRGPCIDLAAPCFPL